MLREAYELAARASVDIGDHSAALDRARRSLRLLPENPFLLVMTADIAAKQSELDLADESARDALRYLTNADAPQPFTATEWPRVRDELRSTAYFVLGRVAATRGAYVDARRSLLMALSLNHDEIDALYTLGVVQMALHEDDAAAASFAHVMRTRGPAGRRGSRVFDGSLRAAIAGTHQLRDVCGVAAVDTSDTSRPCAQPCGWVLCRIGGLP